MNWWMYEGINDWINERMNDELYKLMYEWVNEWMEKWIKKWMYEWMNEQINIHLFTIHRSNRIKGYLTAEHRFLLFPFLFLFLFLFPQFSFAVAAVLLVGAIFRVFIVLIDVGQSCRSKGGGEKRLRRGRQSTNSSSSSVCQLRPLHHRHKD